jgi:hypothetical protein
MRLRQLGHRAIFPPCAAALLLLLSGCYSKHLLYPEAWPPVTEARDIESRLIGKYSCIGEIAQTRLGLRTKGSIADFLIGGATPPDCAYIEIVKARPEEVTIRFMFGNSWLYADHAVTERSFKKGEGYNVEDGWLVLRSIGGWEAEDIFAAHESQTARLSVDVKGDLIVKQSVTVIATIMIVIPTGSSATEWGKFDRLE